MVADKDELSCCSRARCRLAVSLSRLAKRYADTALGVYVLGNVGGGTGFCKGTGFTEVGAPGGPPFVAPLGGDTPLFMLRSSFNFKINIILHFVYPGEYSVKKYVYYQEYQLALLRP